MIRPPSARCSPGELQAVEYPLDVHREAQVELGLGDLAQRLGDRDRRVVHQDVPVAEFGQYLLDHRGVLGAAADVCGDRGRGRPRLADARDYLARGLWGVVVVDHYLGSRSCERGGDRLADPGGRPGNQGHLPRQGCRRVVAHGSASRSCWCRSGRGEPRAGRWRVIRTSSRGGPGLPRRGSPRTRLRRAAQPARLSPTPGLRTSRR